jgi:nifR3 family TIM-barrel protein
MRQMLRIGDVQLETNLLLAPIAGFCDLAFRKVVRRAGGVGLACTDLLCPHAVLRENDKSLWLAATDDDDKPICMQLYGRHPDIMADAARWAESRGATTIDINMGCPVDKVTKKNGGSKLLCEPDVAFAVARAVVDAVSVPVTAKIRLGWDDTRIITKTLPPKLADFGIAAVTVHGRTTEQKFKGSARLEGIAEVVEVMAKCHPHVPVIGNGDITSPQAAKHMLGFTGCAGVMIGRGALAQPWIFRDTAHYLATGELSQPLPRSDRVRMVLEHFDNLLHYRGERVALRTMTQRISRYSPHLQPWPKLRHDARRIDSAAAFREFLLAGIERIEVDDRELAAV